MVKASGGKGIPVEQFQILKDDAVKVLHSLSFPTNLENSTVATGLGMVGFHSNPKKRHCQKNVQTTAQLHSSHRLAKQCSKFSKPDFNKTWTHELPDVQAGFRKGRGTRDQIANIHWIIKKSKRVPEKKNLLLLYWLCQSLWLCGSQKTGKFWKSWEYQPTWPASWEIYMQVRKQKIELDMEQQTGSNLGKACSKYIKAVYCHPAYLTYMQSTSCKILSWMKNKLESRLPREI